MTLSSRPRSTGATGCPSPREDRVRSGKSSVLRAVGTTMIGVAILTVPACGRPAAAARPSNANATTTMTTTSTLPATTRAATPSAAQPTDADPRVGAIFLGDSRAPTCSGSVLHSAAGDLVLTAAHCLLDGVDATFVPGFTGDAGPDDAWSVEAIYLDPRWVDTQDPLADYAIARVERATTESIESQVGGGLLMSPRSTGGGVVAVTGYRLGAAGAPIHCQASTETIPGGFLSLPCDGLVAGTSGAPWIAGSSTVVGLTGGLQSGGCTDDVSYSPPFDEQIMHLLGRAEEGGSPDTAPTAFAADCPEPA